MALQTRIRAVRTEPERGWNRGDTLIEILVALTIIGICVVPLLNSLVESLTGSTQHRSVATIDTLLKSFAETAKSEIELNPGSGGAGSAFTACSTSTGGANYQLLSAPTPSTATVGTTVSIFGTGFHAGVGAGSFTVKVGSTFTTPITSQSQSQSDPLGNIQLTFVVPTVATGPQTLTVSDNQSPATTDTSVSGLGLTVASGAPGPTTSADFGYTMGIHGVQYLDSDTGTFESCTSGTDTAATTSGIEMVTLLATAPTGNSDTLSFIVRNSAYAATSVPTPQVVVSSNPTTLSRPSGASTATIQFTATVEPPATNPPATGTVTWTTSPVASCNSTSQSAGSGNAEVATCTININSSSSLGSYTATATYPADAYNGQSTGTGTATIYASDGSGTETVSPGTVWAGSIGNTLVLTYTAAAGGISNGEVDVAVPAGWTAPQTTSATLPGYTTTSASATLTTSGQTIKLVGLTLTASSSATVTYGAGGGSSGVTAPAATGSYPFTTSEMSTSGGSLNALASSPSVTVLSEALVSAVPAMGGTTITAPLPVTAGANVNFVIYAFTSNSGSGDGAALSSTGFTTAPTPTQISAGGQGQAFDNNLSHAWAWYATGGSGSGTFQVKFGHTIARAFLDVVQINGLSNTPPIVTATKGFAVSGGSSGSTTASNPATANLSGSPNASDAELIFVGAQGDFGATAPTLSSPGGFTSLASSNFTNGSRAIFRGLVTNSEQLTMASNQNWGTMALEING